MEILNRTSKLSILVICVFALYLLTSCSGLLSTKINHNIAVLSSGKEIIPNKTRPPEQFKEFNIQEETDITFNFTYLNGKNDSLNFYKTASTLYDFIKKHGVSLIISDNRFYNYYSIDMLAGYLGIPVIKWFYDDFSPLVKERSTILYTEPNPASQLTVIVNILQHYGWNRVAIVSDNNQNHLKMVENILGMLHGKELLLNLTIKHDGDSLNIIEMVKAIKFRVVVMFSQPVLATKVLRKAKLYGAINNNCTWILGDTKWVSGSHKDFSAELPSEIMQLKLSGRRDTFSAMPDYFVKDSIALFRKALTYQGLTITNCQGFLQSGCSGVEKDRFGKSLHKAMLRSQIEGYNGKIQFDSNGYRTNLSYDIIYRKASKSTETISTLLGKYLSGNLTIYYDGWPPTFVKKQLIWQMQIIRVSVQIQEPFVFINKDKKERDCEMGLTCLGRDGDKYCCYGYCIYLLKLLIRDLKLTVSLHVVKDDKYGAINRTTGQWSGLIGELIRGEADMAVADLTITQERSEVVDFTYAYMNTGLAVLVKFYRLRGTNNLTGFSEPFTVQLWLTVLVLLHVIVLCMWLLERFSPYGLRKRRKPYKKRYTFSFVEAVWYVVSLVFSSFPVDIRPKSIATRCVTVCSSFCLLIIVTSYTANLAAFLVVDDQVLPLSDAGIKDPKLQNPPTDFTIATIKGTSPENLLKTSTDPLYRRIWRNMRDHDLPNVDVALNRVSSGRLKAFVYEYVTLQYLADNRKECDFAVLGKPFFQSGLSFALPKNSFLTERVSETLINYDKHGTGDFVRNYWFVGHCQKKQKGASFFQVSIDSISGPFIGIGAGVAISLIFFIVGYCFRQFSKWKGENITD